MSAKRQRTELAEYYADQCNRIFASDVISADDRIEIETLCALAIELIKNAAPSVIREAGRVVELRNLTRRLR